MKKRTKVDIANEREIKKRELEELIEGIDKEEITPELQEKIDVIEEEITELEKELEEIEPVEPIEQNSKRNIKVVRAANKETRSFSLLNAVRSVVENRQFDPFTEAIIEAGKTELRHAGVSYRGQIVLPENRAAVQAKLATAGLEAIALEKMDLVGPLYAELALNKVGATFLTGLVSDVSIPKYSGTNVGWAGEISAAADGAGTFSEVTLKPKRLTAYIDISKQFLLQDSTSAEMLLRSDIIEAIKQKLESTLLGGLIGSVTVPQGLFYDPTTAPQVMTYNELLDVEMKLLNNNASPKFYLASPLAYAKLRNISKPESAVTDKNLNISVGASIVDSNSVSGIPLVVNSNVYVDSVNNYGGYLIGDFSNYVIGQWGNIDLTVDPYSQAINGCVRLVVNAYFDAVLKRPTVAAALCV